MSNLKPLLITALVSILAVAIFNRFAPASIKSLVNG